MDTKLETPHLVYEIESWHNEMHVRLRNALIQLANDAAEKENKKPSEIKILDVGSGRGELLKELAALGYSVQGVDFDPVCVELTRQYAPCKHLDVTKLEEHFEANSFDIVICSHVLEHLAAPLSVLNQIKKISKRWVILAVPNLLSSLYVGASVFRYPYSNLTHVVGWDPSHFKVFITGHAGLKLVKHNLDGIITIYPGFLRDLVLKLKLGGVMRFLEVQVLGNLFPWFSHSVIYLCEK